MEVCWGFPYRGNFKKKVMQRKNLVMGELGSAVRDVLNNGPPNVLPRSKKKKNQKWALLWKEKKNIFLKNSAENLL